jgi:methyl-accepting chemotaxis protein
MIRAEIDLEGRIVNCNEIFLKKFELRNLAEVNKKVIQTLIRKSEADKFSLHWQDIAQKGNYYEDYICFKTNSGKELWVLATFNAMKHDDESYDRILLLALEAQEYRKLSLNHSGIKNAVDATGIRARINISGNISEANQTFLNLIDYSADELKTLTMFDLINSLEQESFNKKWEEITKGKNFITAIKIDTKNNKEVWIKGSYYAVNDLNGDIDHVIFIGQDITSEKLLEIKTKEQQEALKEKDNLLNETEKEFVHKLRETRNELHTKIKDLEKISSRDEQVLENTSDAVIITAHDNKIVLFNRAAENMLGYKKEEIINRDIGTLFSDEMIDSDDFIAKYVGPGDNKITGKRKQIEIRTNKGAVKTVLVLISKAVVDGENSYTAFFQEISK